MTRTQQILAGVAAIQLALVGLTWRPVDQADHAPHALVDLPGDVDRLVIHGRQRPGEEASTLELRKEGTDWSIPSLHDYPADPAKVAEVVDKLTALQVRRPIATKAASHASLNVADNDHARTVELYAGDASTTLVLGAASGSAVNVRLANEPETWTVRGWTSYAIGDLPRRYWKPDALSLDPTTVDSLTVQNGDQGFTLERGDGGWTAAGDDRPLDMAKVDGHLKRLASLKISAVVGTDDPPGLSDGTHISWTGTSGGQTLEGGVRIGPSDGENAPIRADGARWVVTVGAANVDPWRTLTLDQLLPPEPPTE